ncbi:Ubiquinone biosynthesis O-methyltransferase, mitochondrial [Gryllus bimaculatus]|nr:Ubiquinone biosynthesis O-methyltransferase, mitochondrial [Gryllus bimaculatus]
MIVYLQRLGTYHLHKFVRYSHSQSTVIEDEISRFNRLSMVWWDEQGDMKPLHSMNGLRVKMISGGLVNSGRIKEEELKQPKPLTNIKLLDVGCGGGILSEALARLGAEVTGLDASEALITTAKHHASQDPHIRNEINYVCNTIEKYSEEKPKAYDVVVASEVVEHISEKKLFLESCVQTLKPGGSLFVTTLNKTYASHLAGIVLAEIIWKILPQNTHDWEKFITPQELESILESSKNKLSSVFKT